MEAAHTNTRTRIRAALCLLALIALIFPQPALAQEPLEVSALVLPGDMTAPGEATFSVTLTNTGRAQAANIRVAPDETHAGVALEPIEAGDTYVFETNIYVTQRQLDAGRVDLIVTYRAGGTNYKKKLAALVCAVSVRADVSLERLMPDCAREGDAIEIVYIVKNVGAVGVTQLTIEDAPGDFKSAEISLAPGAQARVSNYVRAGALKPSSPVARYNSADTGMSYRLTLAERAVKISLDEVYLTWQEHTGDLTLAVQNLGGFSYSQLTLASQTLGSAPGIPDTLGPGESFTYTWRGAGAGEHTCALTARDNAGNEVRFLSEAASVAGVRGVFEGARTHITASARHARISSAGRVNITVSIDAGAHDIRGAKLTEKSLGDVRTLAVLPAGTRTTLEIPVDVDNDRQLAFTLRYTGEQGEELMLSAEPVSIVIAPDGEAPDGARGGGELYGVKGLSNLPGTIIIACSALIILLALLMILKRRERGSKRKKHVGRHEKASPRAQKRPREANARAARRQNERI